METVYHLNVVQLTHSMKISLKVKSERLAIVAFRIMDALNSKGVQVNRR